MNEHEDKEKEVPFADFSKPHTCSNDDRMFNNETQPFPEEEVKQIEKFSTKSTAFSLIAIKKIIYFVLSLLLYSATHLYIRFNVIGTDQYVFAFFQVASLTMFIPISFLTTNLKENCSKKILQEVEQSSTEIAEKMREEFSEIMEKKFYENYFEYSSRFYLLAILLSALYYISIFSYYWGLYYITPLMGNTIYASTVLFLQIIRICTGHYKYNLLSNFILIFYFCGLSCLFGFLYNSSAFRDISILGIIILIVSAFTTAMLINFFNSTAKKYKFYIDILELLGFIGLFCLLVIPFLLLMVAYLTTSGIRIPLGNELFLVLGKAIACSCISDVIIFKCISMFSMSVEVTSLGSLIIILFIFQVIFDKGSFYHIKQIYFGCGVGLMLASLILSIVKLYYKIKTNGNQRRVKTLYSKYSTIKSHKSSER